MPAPRRNISEGRMRQRAQQLDFSRFPRGGSTGRRARRRTPGSGQDASASKLRSPVATSTQPRVVRSVSVRRTFLSFSPGVLPALPLRPAEAATFFPFGADLAIAPASFGRRSSNGGRGCTPPERAHRPLALRQEPSRRVLAAVRFRAGAPGRQRRDVRVLGAGHPRVHARL